MATVSTAYPAQLGARSAQRTPSTFVSGSTIRNDSGVVAFGGSLMTGNPLTTSLTPQVLTGSIDPTVQGSKPYASSEGGVTKANSSLNFAQIMIPRKYVIPGISTELGGSANAAISIHGNLMPLRTFHSRVVDNATLDVTKGWDYTSGQHPALPTASAVSYKQKDGSTAATDDAVNPTATEPGEIAYQTGSNTPTQGGYAAKGNY